MGAYSTAAIPTDNPEARGNPITEDAGISETTMAPNTSSTQVASEDATAPNTSSTQVASEDAPAPNNSSTQVASEDAPAPNTSSTQVVSEDAPGIPVTNSEPRNNRIAEEEEIRKMRKAIQNHIIVAALIATVTFAAGFTLPGGYVQSGSSRNKSNGGMAVLSLPDNSTAIKHRPFFKYFVVADGTAMVLSMCAVGIYFLAALPKRNKNSLKATLIYGYLLLFVKFPIPHRLDVGFASLLYPIKGPLLLFPKHTSPLHLRLIRVLPNCFGYLLFTSIS